MTAVLATTLQAMRAHIAAGVLREHGIEAWVWQDASTGITTPVTTGGCQLVVAEEDAVEAAAVLNALPAEPLEAEAGTDTGRSEFSLASAIGNGFVQGAINLPVFLVVVTFLWLVIYSIEQILSGHPLPLPVPSGGFLYASLKYVIGSVGWGAVLGALTGIIVWLFAAYRRKHPAGEVFILLIAIILII